MLKLKGFTLIELIVVMAVIAVLASIVIVALNPLENINKAKDTGRITAITQLGQAMRALTISQTEGQFPVDPLQIPTWQTSFLLSRSEISDVITVDPASVTCSINNEGNICYSSDGSNAVIWTILQANSHRKQANCLDDEEVVAVWIGSRNRVGISCIDNSSSIPPYNSTLY